MNETCCDLCTFCLHPPKLCAPRLKLPQPCHLISPHFFPHLSTADVYARVWGLPARGILEIIYRMRHFSVRRTCCSTVRFVFFVLSLATGYAGGRDDRLSSARVVPKLLAASWIMEVGLHPQDFKVRSTLYSAT